MTLLAVHGLSKSFGPLHAVREVGLAVAAGERLAVIGPNGAGKSTCFDMIGGQLRPDAGRILLAGEDVTGLPPHRIWAKGVGRTFQIAATFASMSVVENVQMALMSHRRRLSALWPPARREARPAAMALLERVGMAEQADRPAATLAYGDLKLLELAVALAHAPKLLLMDEPTAGMAPSARHELMALTSALVAERGAAVLFTEHDMDIVFEHADRIVVLAEGSVVASGPPATIRADPRVQELYLGQGHGAEG